MAAFPWWMKAHPATPGDPMAKRLVTIHPLYRPVLLWRVLRDRLAVTIEETAGSPRLPWWVKVGSDRRVTLHPLYRLWFVCRVSLRVAKSSWFDPKNLVRGEEAG